MKLTFGPGIHPQQRNVRPFATGVSYERFLIDNASKQDKVYLNNPAYRDAWAAQKWLNRAVSTPRDNYGWTSL